MLAIRHGNEHNTIQLTRDGINFEVTPDAFTDTRDGRGITWVLYHLTAVIALKKRLVVMNLIPPTAFWSRSFLINISQVFEQDGTYGRR